MKRPDPKDYPPQSPHDLEWGNVNQQYYEDLRKWEELQVIDQQKLDKEIIKNINYVKPDYWEPKQKEALFPRSLLEPLYNKWKIEHATSDRADDFFYFLLQQTK